jgi:hypothetical protein
MRRLLLLDAQGLDLLTFLWAVSVFGLAESNSSMKALYVTTGVLGIVVAKGIAAGLFGWFGHRWEHRYGKRTFLTFGIWLGLVGAATNVAAVGIAQRGF